jgi:hypothetical protein
MADFEDEINAQSPKRLIGKENQHVRVLLERDHWRARLYRSIRRYGTWAFTSAATAAAIAQLLDWLRRWSAH